MNNQLLIVYKSKYGASKTYTEWTARHFGTLALSAPDVTPQHLTLAHTVVLFGGLYADTPAFVPFAKKHQKVLADKQVFLFAVGATPYEPGVLNAIQTRLKGTLSSCPLFYGRGALDMDAMSSWDRFLCRLLQKSVAKKDPATLESRERALLEAGSSRCSWLKESYLHPLYEKIQFALPT